MRPDLADPETRAAYRRELLKLARGWRIAGVLLNLGGVGLWLYGVYVEPWRPGLRIAGWSLIGLGWILFAGVIAHRTRYHRARMAEPAA
jgi:hypothetical protein